MNESFSSQAEGAESLLAMIVDSCLDDIRGHENPRVQEYLAQYPELAEKLQAILPALGALGDVEMAEDSDDSASSASGNTPPAQLGDFVIRRELGRGGMGVVYEAYQTSLHRTVALKVLPFAPVLDPRDIQRFRNEAQIAAQLNHPHIVPVYAVGCEEGVHFYAMRLIQGQSVAQLIKELSQAVGTEKNDAISTITEHLPAASAVAAVEIDTVRNLSDTAPPTNKENFRAIAWLGIQAAEALEYAHSVGLVHRDIKPSNLLIDREGALWVSDFGLAKVATSGQLTLTGDLLGTIAYMSPEQASGGGSRVDHRSDIYSLGATLYELVALRRPFESNDRVELLRLVAENQARPLRQLNRAVPLDLETIIHKAMAWEPGDRYATCQELSDDLRRFLESKPILARRPSLLDRSGKWVQRHRVFVLGLALFLLLSTVGSTVAAALVLQQKSATDQALVDKEDALLRVEEQSRRAEEALAELSEEQAATEAALTREQEARQDAQNTSQRLRSAVDDLYYGAITQWLEEVPHMTRTQQQVVEKAYEYYQEFSDSDSDDPELQHRTAVAKRQLGLIQQKLGHHDQALEQFDESSQKLEPLLSEYPTQSRIAIDLGKVYSMKIDSLLALGRFPECQETMARLDEVLAAAASADPNSQDLRLLQLQTDCTASFILSRLDHKDLAEARILRALEREEGRSDDLNWHQALEVSSLLQNLAHIEMSRDHPGKALEYLNQSEPYLDMAMRKGSADWSVRFAMCVGANDRASALELLNRPREAEEELRRALHIAISLQADFPEVIVYPCMAAKLGCTLGKIQIRLGNYSDAEELLTQALNTFSQATRKLPDSQDYRYDLIRAHAHFARYCMEVSRTEEAVEHFEIAIRSHIQFLDDSPDSTVYTNPLAFMMGDYAFLRAAAVDEEFRDPELSYALARRAVEIKPNDFMANASLGMALCRLRKYEEAIEQLNTVLDVSRDREPVVRYFLALAYYGLDDNEAAREQYRLAQNSIELNDIFVSPLVANLQREVAETLRTTQESVSEPVLAP